MGLPCEKCIVYAICRAKYNTSVGPTIECEDLWNYVVEETTPPKNSDWLNSKERQVRIKRMNKVKELFPEVIDIQWGGDKL